MSHEVIFGNPSMCGHFPVLKKIYVKVNNFLSCSVLHLFTQIQVRDLTSSHSAGSFTRRKYEGGGSRGVAGLFSGVQSREVR